MKPMNEEHLAVLRRHMVEVIAIHADLASEELGKAALDERVMAAMLRVPRHLFIPVHVVPYAYQDMPLPIGFDKTVSQPFIVALMTDLLSPQPHETVLEIGTGLGYQTAVLAELGAQVWSVEIIEEFASHAEALLRGLGSSNVGIRVGDGSRGWPEHAPFDKILVTAAADGRLRLCLNSSSQGDAWSCPWELKKVQSLTLIEKDAAGRLHDPATYTSSVQPTRNGLRTRDHRSVGRMGQALAIWLWPSIYTCSVVVSLVLPCGDFGDQVQVIVDASIEVPPLEDADLDSSKIVPPRSADSPF